MITSLKSLRCSIIWSTLECWFEVRRFWHTNVCQFWQPGNTSWKPSAYYISIKFEYISWFDSRRRWIRSWKNNKSIKVDFNWVKRRKVRRRKTPWKAACRLVSWPLIMWRMRWCLLCRTINEPYVFCLNVYIML